MTTTITIPAIKTHARLDAIQPAKRWGGSRQDVWSIINEAAAASPVQPFVNMSQGYFGWNPPEFIREAAKQALDQFDCNRYAPTKGRLRLREAISETYSPLLGRRLDPATEIAVTTGANEGMLSVWMAFLNPGDEVILFEPYFDQYLDDIQMAGGVIRCVPLHPPSKGDVEVSSSSEWTIDFPELERAISRRTKMIVINTPHNPTGKVFAREELQCIGDICVKHNLLILSDEVYDRLDYAPFTRVATLGPEIQQRTLTVCSVGKHFFCTGWRVGWVIGPARMIETIATAHLRICYCTPGPFQEAAAVAYEQSLQNGFWSQTREMMRQKMTRFCEVFQELGLPYSDPEGGYFVLVNLSKVRIPRRYPFPPHIQARKRDFHLAWFLIMELGVAAIPPSEFYSAEHAHLGENYLRFAVCKDDGILDLAKDSLRGLAPYINKS
ncbi:kynurenine aminotransferase [Aspergillus ellipticus CBS 707.79]|uniref:Kynurenine aminotransferase n=1 Tax=Aspergillus ellipticus CBS 707.79 TaxID=1448320 RepID=A0A319D158_9EURO|nr:kynurenine aminotransferase [Aspergillus ellipticus CBS 707.79]